MRWAAGIWYSLGCCFVFFFFFSILFVLFSPQANSSHLSVDFFFLLNHLKHADGCFLPWALKPCSETFIYDTLVGFYVWVRNSLGQQSKKLESFVKNTELIIAELRGTEPFRTEACHLGLLALEPAGGILKKKLFLGHTQKNDNISISVSRTETLLSF